MRTITIIFFICVTAMLGAFEEIMVDSPKTQQEDYYFSSDYVLIRANQATKYYGLDGLGVSVAVLDTGISDSYGDFSGRILCIKDFVDPVGNGYDENGHGTAMAGIIGANGYNLGIARAVGLVILRVGDRFGRIEPNATMDAFRWILENHKQYRIVAANLSFGGGNYQDDSFFPETVNVFRVLRDAGVAVVCSAGNSFYDLGSQQGLAFPAVIRNTISVGSVFGLNAGWNSLGRATAYTSAVDRMAPFSQRLHGSVSKECSMDVLAPGIMARTSSTGSLPSVVVSGTSVSAAMVSGAIALLQQYSLREFGKLVPVDDMEKLLKFSGIQINDGDDEDDNVLNTELDWPRIDVKKALINMQGCPVQDLNVISLKIKKDLIRPDRDVISASFTITGNMPIGFYEGVTVLLIGSERIKINLAENGKTVPKAGRLVAKNQEQLVFNINIKRYNLGDALKDFQGTVSLPLSIDIGGILFMTEEHFDFRWTKRSLHISKKNSVYPVASRKPSGLQPLG